MVYLRTSFDITFEAMCTSEFHQKKKRFLEPVQIKQQLYST